MTYFQWLKQYHSLRDQWLATNDTKFERLLVSLRQKIPVPDLDKPLPGGYRSHVNSASKAFTEDYRSLMEGQLESSAQLETKGGLLQAHPFLTLMSAFGLTGGVLKAVDYYSSLPKEIAKEAMSAVLPSGKTLSDAIWDLNYSQDITQMVNNGILNHLNPEMISKQLDNFLLPGREVTTLTPYGRTLNFDAMRLARTEVMKSAADAQKEVLTKTPWVTGLLWDAEGEQPCDECDGLNGTVYETADEAEYPAHPQCKCVLVPQTMNDEEWDSAMNDFLTNGTDEIGIAEWMAE